MSIALVISDIDGTLITSNHEVTEETKRTARVLEERGIRLSLASSRPPRAVVPIANEIGLDSVFAAFNGAMILTSSGEILAESTIAPSVTARIHEIAIARGLDVWIYSRFDWLVSRESPFVEREEHTTGLRALLDGYRERLATPLNKLTVVGPPPLVAETEMIIAAELRGQVSASRSKPRFLDVTASGWHKGSVVKRLSGLFNAVADEIAVIGDGPNDVEMFAAAGLSIAMGQAVDEVRSKATYITSSNDDEGWSRGIGMYVLEAA